MAERNDKPPFKVDVEDFSGWCSFFMAFLMKYEGAHEAIQIVMLAIKSAEKTAVRQITHGKRNNIAFSYLMEACTKGPETSLVPRTYKGT